MAYYTYLIKNNSGIYYFRMKIPLRFRPKFNNRSEIRKSLKTRCKKDALQKSQQMAEVYRNRFSNSNIKQSIEEVTPVTQLTQITPRIIQNNPIESIKNSNNTLLLSQCIKTYLDNIKIRHPEKAKFHILEKQPMFERLLEIIGDKQITEITFSDASNFFAKLQLLPSNMRKFFPNGETITEIINSERIKTLNKLSSRTVNKYMENITTLFKFFVQNGVLKINVFNNKNLRAIEKKRACDRKQRFNTKDLKSIFETGKYFKTGTKDKFFKESYYWIPLIALYTGARVTEISQLHVTDIIKIENIWCISISETTNVPIDDLSYKSVKNKSSCRLIPIHNQLIKLGFLEYVGLAKAKNEIRIFNDITRKKKGVYGGIVGGWFNKNKKKYFNLSNPKQTFHSFRHTFIDELKQLGVKEELVAVVVGHARHSITFNVYGKDYSVKFIKKNVIDKLNYKIKH